MAINKRNMPIKTKPEISKIFSVLFVFLFGVLSCVLKIIVLRLSLFLFADMNKDPLYFFQINLPGCFRKNIFFYFPVICNHKRIISQFLYCFNHSFRYNALKRKFDTIQLRYFPIPFNLCIFQFNQMMISFSLIH